MGKNNNSNYSHTALDMKCTVRLQKCLNNKPMNTHTKNLNLPEKLLTPAVCFLFDKGHRVCLAVLLMQRELSQKNPELDIDIVVYPCNHSPSEKAGNQEEKASLTLSQKTKSKTTTQVS